MTIETKIAKNGSKRYYVRDDNGKLSQISRQKAYELQIEDDNKIMANLFEQTAEEEMTDIEQANYIARVDIETAKSPTAHIKYAINLDTAAKFIRLCGEAFGDRLVNAYIRDTKNNTVNIEAENESTSTESANENSENNAELVNQLKTFSAKVRGLSCEEFLAENAGLSIAEYREQKAAAENEIANREIEFKIEDIKSEIGRLESENYYTARNLYGIVVLEKHYATDESLQAYAAELVDEFNDRLGKINELKAELATLEPATETAEAETETATETAEAMTVYITADNTEVETANIEGETETTPEYKYYIKSRRPISGAAPNGYIKAVSGEVHEPVRRPNGTYSPKCRIYFATVIYDKPLTNEQITNYDLAVSNETFELLNATNDEAETPINEAPNAPEVARFKKGKTYRYYDANTGEPLWYITIDKRTNTSVTVSGVKFKIFIQNHDRFLNYNKPTESFIRGNYRIDAADACEESADEITPATLQKFIEAKKEVSYWRNSNGARIWQIAYIRYGVNDGIVGQTPWLNRTMKEADRYLKDEYGMTLLEYLAAEDKWNDTDKGSILKDKIERDCQPSIENLPPLYPAEDSDDDDELIDPPEIEFNEHIFIGQDGTNFIIRAKNLNITVEDRKIKINGHIVAKYKTDVGVAAALKYVTDWRNNIANYKTFDINDWNTVFDDFDFAGGNEDKFVYIDDEPPVTSKTITPDEMLAIIDTLDTVNAAAPYGWQIEFDGKNFPIEFNGKLVTTLDSLALAKALPPDKFFEQFNPDVPPKEHYINERRKELNMLLDFRKFVEDDPDRLNTLANLIEDVKREILNVELDTEHPPDIKYDEHGNIIPWF